MSEKKDEREWSAGEERILIELDEIEVDVMRLLDEIEAETVSGTK